MAVFLFPILEQTDAAGRTVFTVASIVQAALESVGVQNKRADPLFRQEKARVMRWDPLARRENQSASLIIVDHALPFTAADVREDWSFGNGVMMGGILLRNGVFAPCGSIVVDDADVAAVQARLADVKGAFRL